MMDKLTWRRGAADDQPLLFTLFAADKSAEFAPLQLTPEQLQPLLDMQFRARSISYGQSYPAAVDMILCLEDGTPVGRHLVERQPTGYRSIDLAILPAYRNRGIGTWALRQAQLLAQLEGVCFHLRVLKTNPALRLYERLGFLRASADDISYEMEWQPTNAVISTGRTSNAVISTDRVPHSFGASYRKGGVSFAAANDAVALPHTGDNAGDANHLDPILTFLREIGLTIQLAPVPRSTFLPGIQPIASGLRIDTAALLYPGDLLHEAGHLAVMTPDRRAAEFPISTDAAEEMAALAWSYAAAMHLGLAPEVVFHEHGYRGQSQSLIAGFQGEQPIGLPYLWWIGLTTQSFPGQPSIFPRMTHWLRQPTSPTAESVQHASLYQEALA